MSPLLLTGCAAHRRVYDSYDHGYRQWNGEAPYYRQWEHDTHRGDEDYNRRSPAEQRQYWQWRHNHEDHHRQDDQNRRYRNRRDRDQQDQD